MANLARMRVPWTGSQVVGPSVSTFFFDAAASGYPGAVLALFDALKGHVPSGVQITVPNTGDLISDTTGALIGSWTEPGGGVVTGSGSGGFVLGTGYRLVWETNGIRNGRHVRGTTFIVPVISTAFDSSGRLTSSAQTTALGAAAAYISALGGSGRVWSRPRLGANGESNEIVGRTVSEQPSWLRSRRV